MELVWPAPRTRSDPWYRFMFVVTIFSAALAVWMDRHTCTWFTDTGGCFCVHFAPLPEKCCPSRRVMLEVEPTYLLPLARFRLYV